MAPNGDRPLGPEGLPLVRLDWPRYSQPRDSIAPPPPAHRRAGRIVAGITCAGITCTGITFIGSAGAPVALAHQVQVAETVGATLHIEPNDVPRAGNPSQVWFALTQAGGKTIPLGDCDCTLTLADSQGNPLATPPLSPISAEGYENIPGAMVTFPTVGAYELTLAGQPQNEGDFEPFTLSFPVTVAAGTPASPEPEAPAPAAVAADPATTVPATGEPQGGTIASPGTGTGLPWIPIATLGTVALLLLLGGVIYRLRSPGEKQ